MHPCLRVDEIVRLVASELVASKSKATAAALARCCKIFEDPALDSLWGDVHSLFSVLSILPEGGPDYEDDRDDNVCLCCHRVRSPIS
jgi:hypothetical protein